MGAIDPLSVALWILSVAILAGFVVRWVRKDRPETDSQVEQRLRNKEQLDEAFFTKNPEPEPEPDPEKPRPWQLVPIPAVGAIAARASKEPLYDREIVGVGSTHMGWFRNFCAFSDDGQAKSNPIDTNMHGSSCLPRGYMAHVTGISFVPDQGSLSDEEFASLKKWLRAEAALDFGGVTSFRKVSMNDALADDAKLPAYEFGQTFKLVEMEYFKVDLLMKHPCPVRFSARVYLHGTVLRPVSV